MKRLSPQPVVSVRPLVLEKMGVRHQGHAGMRIGSLDATPPYDGSAPTTIHTRAHASWNSARPSACSVRSRITKRKQGGFKSTSPKQSARGGGDQCCAETSCTQSVLPAIGPVICPGRGPAAHTPHEISRGVRISYSSPYFSSSLTLSIWGAASPARHVLTRPRPHPFSRHGKGRTPAPSSVRTPWSLKRAGDAECVQIVSRHGCQPWTRACGVDPQEATTFSHSPAPWQSRGRVGMLSCRARIPKSCPDGHGFSDLWIA